MPKNKQHFFKPINQLLISIILILSLCSSSVYCMLNLNTLLTNPKTEEKKLKLFSKLGDTVSTKFGSPKDTKLTSMTNKEFEDYLHKETQKKIDDLTKQYEKQQGIKKGTIKPDSDKKPKLLYFMLPDSIKNATHGSLKKPKKMSELGVKLVTQIEKNIEKNKQEAQTGATLHDVLAKASGKDKDKLNPFINFVELQELISDPESALKDLEEGQMLAVRAKILAQTYSVRMKKIDPNFNFQVIRNKKIRQERKDRKEEKK